MAVFGQINTRLRKLRKNSDKTRKTLENSANTEHTKCLAKLRQTYGKTQTKIRRSQASWESLGET